MESSGAESEKYDDYYLQLSSDPVRFESVNSLSNIFFDDSKQQVSFYYSSFSLSFQKNEIRMSNDVQVFAVCSGAVTWVLVKGPDQNITFRMENKGPVISIKFSPSMNILAIQRTNTSVEFVNYSASTGLDNVEYSQSCKGKNATVQGFVWTHGNEILLVTDHGVELFLVHSYTTPYSQP